MPEDTQGPRQRFPAGCGFSDHDGTARQVRLQRPRWLRRQAPPDRVRSTGSARQDRVAGRVMSPARGGAYARGVSDPVGAGSQGGGRPPTIYEVARQAGVSIATVSRVISGASRVGEASRRRVEHAVAATGWVPDPAARQLAGAGGDVVVLAIGVADRQEFAADPYYARVIAGAQEETARRGLSLAVQLGQRGSVAASGAWRGNRRCLGVVLVNVDAEEAAGLSGLGPPLVSMGRSGPSLPSVDPENEAGAAAAIQHLVNRGCRRIAMIAGPERNPCARERLAGYRSVMRSAGLPEAVFSADFTRTGAAEATRLLLRATPGPDAVFAASDLMAAAAPPGPHRQRAPRPRRRRRGWLRRLAAGAHDHPGPVDRAPAGGETRCPGGPHAARPGRHPPAGPADAHAAGGAGQFSGLMPGRPRSRLATRTASRHPDGIGIPRRDFAAPERGVAEKINGYRALLAVAPKVTVTCRNPSERSMPSSMLRVFFCASARSGLCRAAVPIFCWARM